MANATQIQAGGSTYDIKDSAARESIAEIREALEYTTKATDSIVKMQLYLWWEQGSISGGSETPSAIRIRTPYIPVSQYNDVTVFCDTGYLYELQRYDANKTLLGTIAWNNTARHVDLSNCAYLRFLLCATGNPPIVPAEGGHLQVYGYSASYEWKQNVEQNYMHDGGYVTSDTMATVLSDANNAISFPDSKRAA